MAVSQYTLECKYTNLKLRNELYLVPDNAQVNVSTDCGDDEILSVIGNVESLSVFDASLSETSSLDERYAFEKHLSFVMVGYHNASEFSGKRLGVRDTDGNFYIVNVELNPTVTYTYTLDSNTNLTRFEIVGLSNYPMMRVLDGFDAPIKPCGYVYDGVTKLWLNEAAYTKSVGESTYVTNDGKKLIEYLPTTLVYTETFDGITVEEELSFQVPMDSTEWRIDLLRFKDNTYVAWMSTLSGKIARVGARYGLQSNFSVDADDSSNTSTATITLNNSYDSKYGYDNSSTIMEDGTSETVLTAVTWGYTRENGGFECIGDGEARYLLQQAFDVYGTPIPRFKAKSGYESMFSCLNIVGTFTDDVRFKTSECDPKDNGDDDGSHIDPFDCTSGGTLPSSIDFPSGSGITQYTFSANTPWSITSDDPNLTVSPSQGEANRMYEITISLNGGSVECIPYTVYEYEDVQLDACSRGAQIQIPYTATTVDENCTVSTSTGTSAYTVSWMCNSGNEIVLKQRNPRIVQLGGCNSCCSDGAGSYSGFANVYIDACASGTSVNARYSATTYYADCSSSQTTGISAVSITYECNSGEGRVLRERDPYIYQYGDCSSCGSDAKKFTGTYQGGTTSEIDCNGNTTLARSEISLGGLVSAQVGECVSEIAEGLLSGCTSLTSVTIPTSVTAISASCFDGDSNLVISSLPSGVSQIWDNTFRGCSSIRNFTIHEGIYRIRANAFMNCSSLTAVTFPSSGLFDIGSGAFQNDSGLTSVDIPSTVTSIGSQAFYNCSGLAEIICRATVPPTLAAVVFDGTNCEIKVPCSALPYYREASGWSSYASRLTSIESECEEPLPSDVKIRLESATKTHTVYCNDSITLTSGETKTDYLNYTTITAATIGSCVTSISYETFSYMRQLNEITIPSGITSIADGAFYNCSGLQKITVLAEIPPTIGVSTFQGTNDCDIYVSLSAYQLYRTTWSQYADRIQYYT